MAVFGRISQGKIRTYDRFFTGFYWFFLTDNEVDNEVDIGGEARVRIPHEKFWYKVWTIMRPPVIFYDFEAGNGCTEVFS